MIIKTKGKKTFGLIGLPRSGTSLLRRIMDSPRNSVCLSEAIYWTLIQYKGQPYKYDEFEFSQPSQIMSALKEMVNQSPKYTIAGDKETYRIHDNQKESVNYLYHSEADFLLCIFREPKACFSSWKRVKWSQAYLDVNLFIKTYQSFCRDFFKYERQKRQFLINYEDLCEKDSLPYLNQAFGHYLSLEGKLRLTKKSYTGSHPKRDLEQVGESRMSYSELSRKEVRLIDTKLSFVYKELKKLARYR